MSEKQSGVDEFTVEKVSLSEQELFTERDEAERHIQVIVNTESSAEQKDKALACLRKIYDKYLECPTLLDRHVEPMVTALMEYARKTIHRENSNNFGMCMHSLSAIYSLSKVRGRKSVQKFLSHEVEDLEPVLQALRNLAADSSTNGHDNTTEHVEQPQIWESLYTLWNWLGTLSLVPFDCRVVLADSTLISSLIEVGKQHLSQAGPIREAAAACLASWLSRPDLEQSELPVFVNWCQGIVLKCCESRKSQQTDIFLLLGTVQTLVTVLKVSTSPRENLLATMKPLWDPFIALAESNLCESNLLLRKFMVKWWSRMGCAYLPPQIASWRYQRGRRFLAENLQEEKHSDDDAHDSTGNESNDDECYRIQHERGPLPDIPDQVEDAMGFIIQGLSDSSTVVRWSAAKGSGRLTSRLPSICADDVLDGILELFTDAEKDKAWHGACLALAELARRGLLLPHRLAEVVPLIVRAIQYDLRRGQTSVGAHVRDAACYTYWAFARAYHPSVLKPFVPELSESIILTCLFDREVNCRRAASAAFQECVGRQGADNFKHGISILTTADYFALGNRNSAFTTIAFHVAQFPEYRRKIINHVYRVKLHHWDDTIRELASKSLYGLTAFEQRYVSQTIVPSLLKTCLDPKNIPLRHGSILGLGEAVLALSKNEDKTQGSLSDDTLNEIAEIVPTIEKKRLYRGRGGEIVRGAVCRLIRCICVARIPMVARQQVRLLDSIDACIPHPNESIQEKACEALLEVTSNYFPVGHNGPSDRLQKRVVDKYVQMVRTSDNPASTRGFSLALGYLPPKLLAPNASVLDSVLDCLIGVSRHDATVGGEKDAETRRNALIALRRVSQTVGIGSYQSSNDNGAQHTRMTQDQVSRVFEAFFTGLQDYNVDRRGDVGSWCRIEAMKGLETMTILTAEQHEEGVPEYFCRRICTQLVGALLKQFSEKLDSARVQAGKCLQRILTKENPEVPYIPNRVYLKECLDLGPGQTGEGSNCADASVTFPMVSKALEITEFFPPIIAGMVISIGGLTESVAKHSSAALLKWAKGAQGSPRIHDLGRVLLDIFKTHSREGRVILPLLKTVDILLSHQCLDDLLVEDTSEFKDSLLSHLSTEARNCNDIHRLFASIDVALGLVNGTSQQRPNEALTFACAMLSHQFPRVRRYAAEHIYVSLLENIELVVQHDDDEQSILEYMLEAPWDSDMSALQCHEMAEKVSRAVGVTLPDFVLLSTMSAQRKKSVVKDDFASYASLLEST